MIAAAGENIQPRASRRFAAILAADVASYARLFPAPGAVAFGPALGGRRDGLTATRRLATILPAAIAKHKAG